MTLVHQPRPRKESVIFDDVLPEDIPHAELTENARIVLGKRYLKKDAAGEPIEEPEVMFWRVARTIADLARDADISRPHLAEALSYRALDRRPESGRAQAATVLSGASTHMAPTEA